MHSFKARVSTLASVKKTGELLNILLKGDFWSVLNPTKTRNSGKDAMNYSHGVIVGILWRWKFCYVCIWSKFRLNIIFGFENTLVFFYKGVSPEFQGASKCVQWVGTRSRKVLRTARDLQKEEKLSSPNSS